MERERVGWKESKKLGWREKERMCGERERENVWRERTKEWVEINKKRDGKRKREIKMEIECKRFLLSHQKPPIYVDRETHALVFGLLPKGM